MFAQHLMQCGMEQMSGSVIAHDIVTPRHVYFGEGKITYFGLTRDNFAHMDDHTRRGTPDIGNLDLQLPLTPFPSPNVRRGVRRDGTNITFIIHLTTRLDIETSLRQNDLYLIAKRRRVDRLSIDDNGKHFAFNARTGVWVIVHTVFAKFLFLLQAFQNTCKEFRIFTALFTHGLAAT